MDQDKEREKWRKAFGLPEEPEDNRDEFQKALGVPVSQKPVESDDDAFIRALGVHNKKHS